ncbi:MAG: RNA methyltransferase [Firmicutes bacterium]|nr:RNA methyltransferase [Bacillota bacterium]
MDERITSRHNEKIKYMRSLQEGKFRKNEGKFLIEGIHLFKEALSSEFKFSLIFYSHRLLKTEEGRIILAKLDETDCEKYLIDDELMEYISPSETPQGITGAAQKIVWDKRNILKDKKIRLVALEEVRDPGNLGAIIRTAACAGFSGVILLGDCADPFNPKVVRATQGAIFKIPLINLKDTKSMKEQFSPAKLKLAASTPYEGEAYYDASLKPPVAIILGTEARGLSEETLSLCDIKIRIPLSASMDSLNLSVSAGILIYETCRQLEKSNKHSLVNQGKI